MSEFLDTLKMQLKKAEESFIPAVKDKTMSGYSEKEYHHAFAYCLICHAEIEDYIESIIRDRVQSNIIEIKSGRGKHKFGISILCWYVFNCAISDTEKSFERIREKHEEIFKNPTETILSECQKKLNILISSNHGIKQENLEKMLNPIGVSISEFDQTWLNDMNSFGKNRGDYAHKSCGAHSLLDPFDAVGKVKNLIIGLEAFDKRILCV